MRRVRMTAVASLAALLLLSGCVAIPTSGSVTAGDTIDTDTDGQVGFGPRPPQKGATQEEIVANFIQAELDPQNRYEIAREFLASSVQQTWNPYAQVTIRRGNGDPQPVGGSETVYQYAMTTSATIGADGVYAQEPTPTKENAPFELVKENGEWRISSLNDGVIVAESNLDSVFAAHPIFFFDPGYRYLVPDVRWFPITSDIETNIANKLIAGPSISLQNGVLASAFPVGTTLDSPVDVQSGVAAVALSEEARAKTTAQDRTRMAQQLSASLTSPTVTSLAITIGGVPVTQSGTSANQQPPVSSSVLVRRDDSFGFVSGGDLTPIKTLSDQVISVGAVSAAYAPVTQTIAARTPTGVYLLSAAGAQPQLVDSRGGLIDPSIDNSGYIWSAQSDNVGSLKVFGPDGAAHDVNVSSLEGAARVVSIEVSRDGTRLLLYLDGESEPSLVVAGIVRGQDGLPTALNTDPVRLAVVDGNPIDATWESDRAVAALSASDAGPMVTEYDISGPSSAKGVVTDGIQLVGGNGGDSGLRVLDSSGAVFRWSNGTSWRAAGYRASFLATQQPG